ncbi:MAG: alpha-E domain-containing protein [Bacteroidota bacterium]
MDGFIKIDFLIGRLKSKVKYSTVDSILEEGLHAYLSGIKESLYEVANALNQNYFAYT